MQWLPTLPNAGAFAFGAVIGWLIYYINRYRKADVQFSDLTTVIGIVGGAGVTSILGETGADKAQLFGGYGLGLFSGFFAYFIALLIMVNKSAGVFDVTWFLDGRRQDPKTGQVGFPTEPPMPGNTGFAAVKERLDSAEEKLAELIMAQPSAVRTKLAQSAKAASK